MTLLIQRNTIFFKKTIKGLWDTVSGRVLIQHAEDPEKQEEEEGEEQWDDDDDDDNGGIKMERAGYKRERLEIRK